MLNFGPFVENAMHENIFQVSQHETWDEDEG
jgi:hypothetical protein